MKILLLIIFLIFQVHANEIFNGCVDPTGRSITTVYDNKLPDFGLARVAHGSNRFTITINAKAIATLSDGMKNFIYWHECGHIALGHLVTYRQSAIIKEQEADCYGIRVPLTLGRIEHSQLQKLQENISHLGPGDWEHFAGGARAVNVKKCLGEGSDEEVWGSCKKKFYANIDFINKTAQILEDIVSACKKNGLNNPECKQGKNLARQLHDGIQKTLVLVDQQCPYVMAPDFSKAIANYSRPLTILLQSK
jgi:hypothetical protein